MKNSRLSRLVNLKWIGMTALFAITAFFVIYGSTPLNVTNDHWIMAGYDETDIIQHYMGWVGFRNADWTFPLGLAKNIGYPKGSVISFTDSLPWISILFKVFRNILPDTFQFFGIYTLLSFILQGIAGYKIVFHITMNEKYSLVSTGLFVFSPILLERSFRHTALGSHWLILFSIYLYLCHRENQRIKHYIGFLLLLVLAIGIHPYFLPMVGAIMLMCLLEDVRKKNFYFALFFLGNLMITYAVGCVIGVLGSGATLSRDGFGYYCMNLNALFNPSSCGEYTWSSVIKVFPQTRGNYDGFNYLGLGMIVCLLTILGIVILFKKWNSVIRIIKREWSFVTVLGCCTLFAISNAICINDIVIAEIGLPTFLEKICGIFRASSRMFYPVYYFIILVIVLVIWNYRKKTSEKTVLYIMICVFCIQFFDLRNCIVEKHMWMLENSSYESIIDDEALKDIAEGNSELILDRFDGSDRILGVWGGKNKLRMYFTTANSGDNEDVYKLGSEIAEKVKKSGEIRGRIIVTSDIKVAEKYLTLLNVGYYELNGVYYLADISTSDCLEKGPLDE